VIFALLPTEREAGGVTEPKSRPLTARERQLRDWQQAQARVLGVKLE
jgi:hypothetical protein